MFGGYINAGLCGPTMSKDAGNVNNGAAAVLEHCCDLMLHRTQNAPNVNIESSPILFLSHLIEWPYHFHASIIEGHIQTAMGGENEVDRLHDICLLGDICANKRGSAS